MEPAGHLEKGGVTRQQPVLKSDSWTLGYRSVEPTQMQASLLVGKLLNAQGNRPIQRCSENDFGEDRLYAGPYRAVVAVDCLLRHVIAAWPSMTGRRHWRHVGR